MSSTPRTPLLSPVQPGPRSRSPNNRAFARHSPARSDVSDSGRDTPDVPVSVNVAVRIRPYIVQETKSRLHNPVIEATSQYDVEVTSTTNKKRFTFDRIFDQSTTQEQIWDYLRPSVLSLTKGYNVSIMAYGQSGSGKSYTMGTADDRSYDDGETAGIVARAARALFAELRQNGEDAQSAASFNASSSPYANISSVPLTNSSRSSLLPSAISAPIVASTRSGFGYSPSLKPPTKILKHHSSTSRLSSRQNSVTSMDKSFPASPADSTPLNYSVSVSYLEIYNEQLRDLLNPAPFSSISASPFSPNGERSSQPSLAIREDVKGNISVSGLKEMVVKNVSDILKLLEKGSKIRQTNSTLINSQSSRSHAVFTIKLSKASADGFKISSKLHLVDLAGSERLKVTGAVGGRAKEGISINSGLASLGKVITQLSTHPSAHISYRDSKLTRFLQDSLGGKAITYLISCVTMDNFYVTETLNTLAYAQRARAIQQTPEIHKIETQANLAVMVHSLQQEVSYWRAKAESSSDQSLSDLAMPMPVPLSKQLAISISSSSTPFPLDDPSDIFLSPDRVSISPSNTSSDGIEVTASNANFMQSKERAFSSVDMQNAVTSTLQEFNDTIDTLQTKLIHANMRISELEREQHENLLQMEDVHEMVQFLDSSFQDNDPDHDSTQPDSLETKMDMLKSENNSLKRGQKSYMRETQYLTAQLNTCKRQVEKLMKENIELRKQIPKQAQLEAEQLSSSNPTSPVIQGNFGTLKLKFDGFSHNRSVKPHEEDMDFDFSDHRPDSGNNGTAGQADTTLKTGSAVTGPDDIADSTYNTFTGNVHSTTTFTDELVLGNDSNDTHLEKSKVIVDKLPVNDTPRQQNTPIERPIKPPTSMHLRLAGVT